MDIQFFVQNIKNLLDSRGISYSRAGRESGAGEDFIRNIDRKSSSPSIDKVKKMADYLGVTVNDLIGEEKAPGARDSPEPEGLDELCRVYRSFNDEGREKLLDYADDMVKSGKYIKTGKDQVDKKKHA